MKTEIDLQNLEKIYEKNVVFNNITFSIKEGEFVSIVGKSGCGKTTLLYLIQGLIKPTSGTIKVIGKLGFVFQDHNLFPWKTVKENIDIVNKDKAEFLLDDIGMMGFENYYPHKISEGMKQRVGIARALAFNPDILLMDEPFASLDYFTKMRMQELILRIKTKRQLTILFVTHDVDEAIKLSDRIIVLGGSPTKIKKVFQVNSENIKESILRLLQ